jgi:uncharacterized membrane protein
MKNKNVGLLILGMAIVLAVIVFLFNSALITIVDTSCSHGTSCPMYGTIRTQTYISIALIAIIIIISLVLIFTKEEKQFVFKKIKEKEKQAKKEINLNGLTNEEKILIKIIQDSNGTIFQSDLVDKSNFDKVKVTRLLDRLEGQGIIERRRRGMTNIVMLK